VIYRVPQTKGVKAEKAGFAMATKGTLIIFSLLCVIASGCKGSNEEKPPTQPDLQAAQTAEAPPVQPTIQPAQTSDPAFKRFESSSLAYSFIYPGDWEIPMQDSDRLAAQHGEALVAGEAVVLAPIADMDRDKANRTLFDRMWTEMGGSTPQPKRSKAGIATALSASGPIKDGRWAWGAIAVSGDAMYRLRIVVPSAEKANYDGLASKVIASLEITDVVRGAASPYGNEPVTTKETLNAVVPPGWISEETRYGYRFAHPQGWSLSTQDRGDYIGEKDGIKVSYLMGINGLEDPGAIPVRPGLRTVFNQRVSEIGKALEGPDERVAGIARAMVGRGETSDHSEFWILVACNRDVVYVLNISGPKGDPELPNVADGFLRSFQVVEDFNSERFMQALTKRKLPWE
jgi:hypothetical protein